MAIFNLTYLNSLAEEADQKRKEITLIEPNEEGAQITYLPFKLKLYWPGCIDSPYYHWKKHTYQLKESPKLRKNTQHYHRIVRKDGRILRIDTFVNGLPDRVLIMHYDGNKRYAFSYSSSLISCVNLTQVLTYENGHIVEDYMIQGHQIVYRKYAHIAGEKYAYFDINYIPTSDLPIHWIRNGTITTGENATRKINFWWPESIFYNENGVGEQMPKLDSSIVEV